jgi:acyl-CoA reductase-like NAD-dependent aldehyde dehydrogenase/DNA-binding LacI/PurR family transcriptional regulator
VSPATPSADGAPPPRRATIRDVAAAAGVSPGTVSKHLTGRPYVSEAMRDRVQRAIDELDFRPDGMARALATGRSKVLGVVVASLANPFYTELVEAIDREATAAGYSLFLATTDRDPVRQREVVAAMLEKGVDGLVLAHVAASDREALRDALRGKAHVLASRHFEGSDDDYVVIDGAAGSRLAAEHLAALGHRRIGYVSGPPAVVQFRARREGFLAALGELGVDVDPGRVVDAPGSSWLGAGHEALDRLLLLPADRRPTAIHTANDLLALGVLQRATARGLRIPGDLSVVGFDNIAFGAISIVPLTTVDARIGDIGAGAARILIQRLAAGAQPGARTPVQHVLAPSLVVRGSTAPPPHPTPGDPHDRPRDPPGPRRRRRPAGAEPARRPRHPVPALLRRRPGVEGRGAAGSRTSPATGETLFTAAEADAAQVDDAVDAARAATDGAWGTATGRDRGAVLRRAAELLAARREAFARVLVAEVGKPVREARGEVDGAVNHLEYCAGLARGISGRTVRDVQRGLLAFTLREPAGVAGLIVPWNFPLAILCQKLPYALAAGCTAVVKPSPFSPVTALALAHLLTEAGAPTGAVNVVLGEGDAGARLVSHVGVDVVSFTGSTAVGRAIAAGAGAQRLKRVAIEAGGKTPVIVLADAPLEQTVEGVLFASFFNQGEVCVSGSRLLVDETIAEPFVERLAARSGALRVGDPFDEATEMGPLISAGHADRLERLVAGAVDAGGRVAAGGGRLDAGPGGPYFGATVMDGVGPGNPLLVEEQFGPVTSVETFAGLPEATGRSNASPFGLGACVWTSRIDTALEAAQRLRVGTVWINGSTDSFPELPLGGRGDSGFGTELGPEGLEFFTDVKTVQVGMAPRAPWYAPAPS